MYPREQFEKVSNLRNYMAKLEESFLKAFNCNLVPMAVITYPDGQYLEVNESFVRITGYTHQELVGKRISNTIMKKEECLRLLNIFKTNNHFYNLEIKFLNKSGQSRNAISSAEMINLGGRPCLLGVMMDVSDKKDMEDEITRLARFNLIGEIAASIGHEIRNPMTAVRGFIQLLKQKKGLDEYNEYFEIMIDEIDRANSIIKEFLCLSKDNIVKLHENNLNTIIKAINRLVQAEALLSDKTINLELGEIPNLSIDENEVRQLILNLVINGLESMDAGGGLTLKTFREKEEVVLVVKDQGNGIDPNIINKLGTPFFTTKEEGTGLGLAVCYNIAARNNAKIQIETGAGGTAFNVRFKIQ